MRHLIGTSDHEELLALGCIADIMATFIDENGRPVDHPINGRTMSVGPAVLRTAKHIVLATGGERRAAAILAVIRCIGCNTLITDEAAARAMLARLGSSGAEVQRDRGLIRHKSSTRFR